MEFSYAEYFIEILETLEQLYSVEEFYLRICNLKELILECDPQKEEKYFIACWLQGLKSEIRVYVTQCGPTTLNSAYKFALYRERELSTATHSSGVVSDDNIPNVADNEHGEEVPKWEVTIPSVQMSSGMVSSISESSASVPTTVAMCCQIVDYYIVKCALFQQVTQDFGRDVLQKAVRDKGDVEDMLETQRTYITATVSPITLVVSGPGSNALSSVYNPNFSEVPSVCPSGIRILRDVAYVPSEDLFLPEAFLVDGIVAFSGINTADYDMVRDKGGTISLHMEFIPPTVTENFSLGRISSVDSTPWQISVMVDLYGHPVDKFAAWHNSEIELNYEQVFMRSLAQFKENILCTIMEVTDSSSARIVGSTALPGCGKPRHFTLILLSPQRGQKAPPAVMGSLAIKYIICFDPGIISIPASLQWGTTNMTYRETLLPNNLSMTLEVRGAGKKKQITFTLYLNYMLPGITLSNQRPQVDDIDFGLKVFLVVNHYHNLEEFVEVADFFLDIVLQCNMVAILLMPISISALSLTFWSVGYMVCLSDIFIAKARMTEAWLLILRWISTVQAKFIGSGDLTTRIFPLIIPRGASIKDYRYDNVFQLLLDSACSHNVMLSLDSRDFQYNSDAAAQNCPFCFDPGIGYALSQAFAENVYISLHQLFRAVIDEHFRIRLREFGVVCIFCFDLGIRICSVVFLLWLTVEFYQFVAMIYFLAFWRWDTVWGNSERATNLIVWSIQCRVGAYPLVGARTTREYSQYKDLGLHLLLPDGVSMAFSSSHSYHKGIMFTETAIFCFDPGILSSNLVIWHYHCQVAVPTTVLNSFNLYRREWGGHASVLIIQVSGSYLVLGCKLQTYVMFCCHVRTPLAISTSLQKVQFTFSFNGSAHVVFLLAAAYEGMIIEQFSYSPRAHYIVDKGAVADLLNTASLFSRGWHLALLFRVYELITDFYSTIRATILQVIYNDKTVMVSVFDGFIVWLPDDMDLHFLLGKFVVLREPFSGSLHWNSLQALGQQSFSCPQFHGIMAWFCFHSWCQYISFGLGWNSGILFLATLPLCKFCSIVNCCTQFKAGLLGHIVRLQFMIVTRWFIIISVFFYSKEPSVSASSLQPRPTVASLRKWSVLTSTCLFLQSRLLSSIQGLGFLMLVQIMWAATIHTNCRVIKGTRLLCSFYTWVSTSSTKYFSQFLFCYLALMLLLQEYTTWLSRLLAEFTMSRLWIIAWVLKEWVMTYSVNNRLLDGIANIQIFRIVLQARETQCYMIQSFIHIMVICRTSSTAYSIRNTARVVSQYNDWISDAFLGLVPFLRYLFHTCQKPSEGEMLG